LAVKARGLNTLLARYRRPDATAVTIGAGAKALSANPLHDVEFRMNVTDTQLGILLNNNATIDDFPAGVYFVVKRIAVWLKPSVSAKLRGY
jgi:hypothetical protein